MRTMKKKKEKKKRSKKQQRFSKTDFTEILSIRVDVQFTQFFAVFQNICVVVG